MMLNIDNSNSNDYVRKIKLAIWKSLSMRKNGWPTTLLEAIAPALIYIFFFILQMATPSFKTSIVNETKTYPPQPLIMPPKLYLLYSPNISDVKEFMNSVTPYMHYKSLAHFVNEKEMIDYIKALQENSTLFNIIGVVFNNYNKDSNELNYRILTESFRSEIGSAFQTDPPYTSVWAQDYIKTGFVSIQKKIDFAFIDKKSNNKLSQQNVDIKLERMPTPPHKIESQNANFLLKPTVLNFSFILLFLKTLLPYMFNEKIMGIRQLMFVMGLEPWQYWLEWFLFTFFAYIFNISLLTILVNVNFTEKFPTFFENSNGFIIWLFLFCFYISNIVVIFLIIAIFNIYRFAQVPVLIYMIIPLYASVLSPENIPFGVNVLLMFIPVINLVFGVNTLVGLERVGGVHFNNLFSNPSECSNCPSIGLILIMFILDTIIYFLLAWYINNLFPGAFGVSKKWNFFFQKSFWSPIKEIDAEEKEVGAIEKIPEIEAVKGLKAGIKIRNLKKKYEYKYAVDGLNIDIYSKEITVLLGHNGAGKTTTIGIITGMIPPTSGTIIVDGKNMETNLLKIQKSIGLCLQHNTEIPYLTVFNHLLYFAMLRGSTMAEAKLEAMQFLESSNLKDKTDTQPPELSGGMRRKLSIGMAMIGNSKVVLLDEPSSGLDPQARRDLWDFLLATRGDRTLLITTHYMEEADVLGDRIAIMHNGQLMCYGTTLFLKNLYNTGYTLSVLVQYGDVSAISNLIKSIVSSAFVKSLKTGSVTYTLPTNDTSSLTNLILALEKNQSNLGIINFGICITSLEDVFIKVGEIADASKGITKIDQNWIQFDYELTEEFSSNLFLSFKALAYKRLHYYRHNKCKTIFTVVFTLCFFIIINISLILMKRAFKEVLIVDLKLDMYDKAESFYSHDAVANMEGITKYYKNVVRAHGGKATKTSDIYDSILDVANADETQYHRTLITGAQFKSGNAISAMYGHYALHGPPISLNLVTNSLLHWCTSDDAYSIQVAYSPLPSFLKGYNIATALIIPIFILFSLTFFLAKCVLILHNENSTGFKHLQQMSGVSKILYWISAFVFDYILYLFIIFMYLIILLIIDYGGCIGNLTTLAYICYFLIIFGFSCFPFTYSFMLSKLVMTIYKNSNEQAIEFALQLYFIIFGISTPFLAFTLTVWYPISNKIVKIVFTLLNYYPLHALVLCLLKVCMKSWDIQYWNENSKFCIMAGHPCVDLNSTQCIEYLSFYGGELSIKEQETFLYWDILIHWLLLILYDIGVVSYCLQLLCGAVLCRICNVFEEPGAEIDDDVRDERNRVKEQLNNLSRNRDYVERDLFLVRNLHKWYFQVYAVNGLNFGVKKGECFGLLGINGAGKSTTFKILTGEIFQNAGNAHFRGVNLNLNRYNFFNKMGYSPQFDGFINDLTVHEMLYILGSIRGIPSKRIDNHIEKWLTIFDIKIYEHMQCARLSGGTKRKLSSALSLIGNPILILLDEPTSGIDPIARRNLWDVLAVLQKSGRSIILTSQSMDECETLCDRLAIMVAGQFQCIGNIQYLKSKFGRGCTIKIKLRTESTDVYLELSKEFKKHISSKIACTLIDEHFGMLVYKVTDKNVPLSNVFILMESLKKNYTIIEDYSISSANLEEIFLSFASDEKN